MSDVKCPYCLNPKRPGALCCGEVHEASAPVWFVQTEDKALHGYYTREVLLCDLALNRGEPVTILQADRRGFTTRYLPVTEKQVRANKVSAA